VIDEGLYALLSNDPGVIAIAGQKIYQVSWPTDLSMLPCVVYSFVGGSVDHTLDTSGVVTQRVELNALSLNASEAARLRAAVITAMDELPGLLPDGTNILNAELLNPGTDFAGEDRVFRRMCEFYVLYTLPN
jgi:hypothetical protein